MLVRASDCFEANQKEYSKTMQFHVLKYGYHRSVIRWCAGTFRNQVIQLLKYNLLKPYKTRSLAALAGPSLVMDALALDRLPSEVFFRTSAMGCKSSSEHDPPFVCSKHQQTDGGSAWLAPRCQG
jgi:hypothetical protein